MEVIFSIVTEPNMVQSGHFGGQIAAKQRTGQKPNRLIKQFKIDLPDKVNQDWYLQLQDKLEGVSLSSLKHTIKIKDNTPFLKDGYNALLKDLGGDYLTLRINPLQDNFLNQLGNAVINIKQQAKNVTKFNYIN